MASIGIKYWGTFKPVPENYTVVPNRIYESRGEFNQDIPSEIALSFLKDWRDRLEVQEGIISNYMEVSGRKFVVQWRLPPSSSTASVTASPIVIYIPVAVWTIIKAILAIAAIVATAYLIQQLAGLVKQTGEVLSILGPENVSMLMNILFLFVFLMMFGPLISMMTELPRRIVPPRRE